SNASISSLMTSWWRLLLTTYVYVRNFLLSLSVNAQAELKPSALGHTAQGALSHRAHHVPYRLIRTRNPTQHRQHHSFSGQHWCHPPSYRAPWFFLRP